MDRIGNTIELEAAFRVVDHEGGAFIAVAWLSNSTGIDDGAVSLFRLPGAFRGDAHFICDLYQALAQTEQGQQVFLRAEDNGAGGNLHGSRLCFNRGFGWLLVFTCLYCFIYGSVQQLSCFLWFVLFLLKLRSSYFLAVALALIVFNRFNFAFYLSGCLFLDDRLPLRCVLSCRGCLLFAEMLAGDGVSVGTEGLFGYLDTGCDRQRHDLFRLLRPVFM